MCTLDASWKLVAPTTSLSIPSTLYGRSQGCHSEGPADDAARIPTGCRFHPRCPFAMDRCRQEEPRLVDVGPHHQSACWLAGTSQHS
nr:oligopeptide/dipeptide ABC transporter ATP-binding protein [Sinorhizobium meliloti]